MLKSVNWEKTLKIVTYISQIILVVVAIYGYFYTVRPIFQKEILSEQVAKKTIELNKLKKQSNNLKAENEKLIVDNSEILENLVELIQQKNKLDNNVRILSKEKIRIENGLKDLESRFQLLNSYNKKLEEKIDLLSLGFKMETGEVVQTQKELKKYQWSTFLNRVKSKTGHGLAYEYLALGLSNEEFPLLKLAEEGGNAYMKLRNAIEKIEIDDFNKEIGINEKKLSSFKTKSLNLVEKNKDFLINNSIPIDVIKKNYKKELIQIMEDKNLALKNAEKDKRESKKNRYYIRINTIEKDYKTEQKYRDLLFQWSDTEEKAINKVINLLKNE